VQQPIGEQGPYGLLPFPLLKCFPPTARLGPPISRFAGATSRVLHQGVDRCGQGCHGHGFLDVAYTGAKRQQGAPVSVR
jgi:hypothetical protein